MWLGSVVYWGMACVYLGRNVDIRGVLMDWKDSIMSDHALAEVIERTPRTSDIQHDICVDILNVATAQAEVSYKAGMKTAVEWGVKDDSIRRLSEG